MMATDAPVLPIVSTIIEAHGPIYNGPGSKRHERPFALRKLEHHQKEAIERAKKYAMEQSIKTALIKQAQSQQYMQINAAKRNQTLNLLNRVYIGSIAYDIKEEMIKQAFLPFGPIKSVSMSWDPTTQKHKGFAFVEYEYPEAAQLAIDQMNGTNFGGRLLKVGRPSNLPDAIPFINEFITEFQLQRRIYVAGIHLDLTELDVALVFEAFGKITMCKFQEDTLRSSFHRGFGYVEFQTEQAANDAVNSMNKFDLGGQLLRVCKAISPPEGILTNTVCNLPAATAVAAASVTAKVLSMEAEQFPYINQRPTSSFVGDLKQLSDSVSSPKVQKVLTSPIVNSCDTNGVKHLSIEDIVSASLQAASSARNAIAEKLANSNVKKSSDKLSSKAPTPPRQAAGKWAQLAFEDEHSLPVFIRSNDSRLYSIPSPSSIPLPPPPPST